MLIRETSRQVFRMNVAPLCLRPPMTYASLVLLGLSDRFWYVASNGTVCSDGETSEDFFFEFRECSRVAIKGKNGKYLRGDPAGTLRADADTLNCATFWEY